MIAAPNIWLHVSHATRVLDNFCYCFFFLVFLWLLDVWRFLYFYCERCFAPYRTCSRCTVLFLLSTQRNEAKCLGNSVMFFTHSFLFTRTFLFASFTLLNLSLSLCSGGSVRCAVHAPRYFYYSTLYCPIVYNIFICFIGLLLFWRWMMLLCFAVSVVLTSATEPLARSPTHTHTQARRVGNAHKQPFHFEWATQWRLHFHTMATFHPVELSSVRSRRWNVNGKCSLLLLC